MSRKYFKPGTKEAELKRLIDELRAEIEALKDRVTALETP